MSICDLISTLTILKEYSLPPHQPRAFTHEDLLMVATKPPEWMSAEHQRHLELLGWCWDDHNGVWFLNMES